MNQPLPPDDADQALRDALRAEAEGVEAPHALLERITAEATKARRPPGWLLAVAVVAAVVVGVGGALVLADDDEPVETINEPTTVSEPIPPTPTPTGERPSAVALVREDGMLMTVNLETGEQRELFTAGDPRESSEVEEGGPQFIDAVELSPDGQWVYFSTCCEPAPGTTFRIPVTGGEPEMISFGAYPRVSPDGRNLATGHCFALVVSTIDGGDPTSLEVDECVGPLAWSPDGRQLAAMTAVGPGETAQMLLFDWDGTSLTPADPGKPDNPGVHVAWDPNGMVTTISGGGSVDSSRSLSQDASYLWLLWVDETGVVREQASLASGELPEIPGLPRAIAADW